MVERRENLSYDEFSGARIQILGTNPNNPYEGRIFVWTKMGWYERLEGQAGNAAFTHIAESQDELRELISRENSGAGLFEIGGEYRKIVSLEFIAQSRSDSDTQEDSQGDYDDDKADDDEQEYHQHGL